jgi:hypothetical protein
MMTNNPMFASAQQMPMQAANPYLMGGVQYANLQPVQMTTGLTKQEIEEMKKNGNGAFRLQITPEEMKRARCCHRDGNQGTLVSTNNPDKPLEVRCTLCGEVFQLLENISPQMVTNHCNDTHDLMNTIKVMYVDLPPKLINEIFQVMPVMDRMKDLFSIAADRYNTLVSGQNNYGQMVNGGVPNGFNMYNAMMSGQAQYAQMPMYGYPQQQVYPQPQMYGFPQQPVQPVMQPQGYPQQQMGYPQPMQMGFPQQMNPMQQQMVANAPGLATNGFGQTEQPQTIQQPGTTADGKPVVTKQLQA